MTDTFSLFKLSKAYLNILHEWLIDYVYSNKKYEVIDYADRKCVTAEKFTRNNCPKDIKDITKSFRLILKNEPQVEYILICDSPWVNLTHFKDVSSDMSEK